MSEHTYKKDRTGWILLTSLAIQPDLVQHDD
jgi:hypothetical protein